MLGSRGQIAFAARFEFTEARGVNYSRGNASSADFKRPQKRSACRVGKINSAYCKYPRSITILRRHYEKPNGAVRVRPSIPARARAPRPAMPPGGADYLGPISATPMKMVTEMLAFAGPLSSSDVVYDLGCNDGRVLVEAARAHGCAGVGVEIDARAVAKARQMVRATTTTTTTTTTTPTPTPTHPTRPVPTRPVRRGETTTRRRRGVMR